MSDKAPATRARQACEPCRRKKTKCPGEKPVCSFCQRLGQRCSYERENESTTRVHKPRRSGSYDSTGSRDRLQRLENRVEEVFDILSNFSGQNTSQIVSTPPTANLSMERRVTRSLTPARESSEPTGASSSPKFHAIHHQEPPNDFWPTLLDIYGKRFDCQPLPVLGPQLLSLPLQKWSKPLRRTFLSLTIPFVSSHGFFRGSSDEAVSFYTKSARLEIFTCIANGEPSVEILQALCLLALRDIIDSNSLGAWMSIGMGVRLALSTNVMSNRYEPRMAVDQDTKRRCCWSLFALDRIYGSTLTVPPTLSTEEVLPDYPISANSPNPPPDQGVQMLPIKDMGVMAYQMVLLSTWGLVMKFVQGIKDGVVEDAWTTNSQYRRVMSQIFDFETKYAQIHRFQQTKFQDRDVETLDAQRPYWAPWLSGQFLFHALQGLLNHPFLHIASRSKQQVFPPPGFLQNSVDQAVLHASWVIKCIETCDETGFIINDPFIAHLVAVTATVYLFLLNAKDDDMALQARLGFDKCYAFIKGMGNTWHHLRHIIEKLDILKHAAISDPTAPTVTSAPRAQRSLLWSLLDYSTSTARSRNPEFASDAVDLNVDTRFLSPLNPLSTGHTPATVVQPNVPQDQQAQLNQNVDEPMWDPSMESFDFNLFDNEQMADLTNLTFGRDLWSFGQL